MKLTIVSTLYNSLSHLREFYDRVSNESKKFCGDDYEIILVNDGSPDKSLELAVELASNDSHVRIIDLSKNFGHHKAIMVGLGFARGEFIFVIDCDLEEQPEWLLNFYNELIKTGSDVVYGVQVTRKGGWFERVSGDLYYRMVCSLMGVSLPKNVVTARLLKNSFLRELLKFEEREMILGGLFSLVGFKQSPILVKKLSTSETTYTLSRKISLLVNSVTSFSSMPLVIVFYLGLFISILSSLYIIYIFVYWFWLSNPPSGYASIVVSIWFVGGLIMFFLGVIGLYLSKIFLEVKHRPYSIIRKTYGIE